MTNLFCLKSVKSCHSLLLIVWIKVCSKHSPQAVYYQNTVPVYIKPACDKTCDNIMNRCVRILIQLCFLSTRNFCWTFLSKIWTTMDLRIRPLVEMVLAKGRFGLAKIPRVQQHQLQSLQELLLKKQDYPFWQHYCILANSLFASAVTQTCNPRSENSSKLNFFKRHSFSNDRTRRYADNNFLVYLWDRGDHVWSFGSLQLYFDKWSFHIHISLKWNMCSFLRI